MMAVGRSLPDWPHTPVEFPAMASGNPALSDRAFEQAAALRDGSGVMTLGGAVAKTGVLTAILFATAAFAWSHLGGGAGVETNSPWMLVFMASPIVGLILAFVTIFVPKVSPYTAPLYAAAQGLFLGSISSFFAGRYEGIVGQAIALTMAVFVVMLASYATGIVRATDRFRRGVFAATAGIALVYLAGFVMSFFGASIPYIHESGWIGIGFSLFVVTIAAMNLVLDFDFIERGAQSGAPKYMEWYAGFGLLVTLVWLYLEILRLLAKVRNR